VNEQEVFMLSADLEDQVREWIAEVGYPPTDPEHNPNWWISHPHGGYIFVTTQHFGFALIFAAAFPEAEWG